MLSISDHRPTIVSKPRFRVLKRNFCKRQGLRAYMDTGQKPELGSR